MKHIVLLDVDETILYRGQHINQALLDSLKAQKITDVCFFTNMDLKDITNVGRRGGNLSRDAIIEEMTRQGFNVHKVITSADPCYLDEHGRLKPIGSAYEELYAPLMQRVKENGPLDLTNYSSNSQDLVDFYHYTSQWQLTSIIARARCDAKYSESKIYDDLPSYMVLNKKTGDTYDVDFSALSDLLNSCEKGNYAILGSTDRTKSITIKGSHITDNKALMMQHAIGELLTQHGPVAITYFDDKKVHLNGVREYLEPYIKTGLVSLSEHEMSRDLEVAQGPEQIDQYAQTITRSTGLISKTEKLTKLLNHIDDFYLIGDNRVRDLLTIRENLNYASSPQMLQLASLAMKKRSVVFESQVSLKTAFQCLQIAHLKANSREELLTAERALSEFLQQHPSSQIDRTRSTDRQIAGILSGLQTIARTEGNDSVYARSLAERLQRLGEFVLNSLEKGTEAYKQQERVVLEWKTVCAETNASFVTMTNNNVLESAPITSSSTAVSSSSSSEASTSYSSGASTSYSSDASASYSSDASASYSSDASASYSSDASASYSSDASASDSSDASASDSNYSDAALLSKLGFRAETSGNRGVEENPEAQKAFTPS